MTRLLPRAGREQLEGRGLNAGQEHLAEREEEPRSLTSGDALEAGRLPSGYLLPGRWFSRRWLALVAAMALVVLGALIWGVLHQPSKTPQLKAYVAGDAVGFSQSVAKSPYRYVALTDFADLNAAAYTDPRDTRDLEFIDRVARAFSIGEYLRGKVVSTPWGNLWANLSTGGVICYTFDLTPQTRMLLSQEAPAGVAISTDADDKRKALADVLPSSTHVALLTAQVSADKRDETLVRILIDEQHLVERAQDLGRYRVSAEDTAQVSYAGVALVELAPASQGGSAARDSARGERWVYWRLDSRVSQDGKAAIVLAVSQDDVVVTKIAELLAARDR